MKAASDASLPEVPVELFKLLGHDVRNALTSIQLLTQIALRHKETATAEHLRTFLTKIDSQSTKLCTVVNDLLDVARIQAGRLTIRKQTVQLDGFLEEVREKAPAADAMPPISWSGSPATGVELDPGRMNQVLTCILAHGARSLPGLTGIRVSTELLNGDLKISTEFLHPEAEPMSIAFHGLDDQAADETSLPDPSLYIAAEIIRLHEGTVRIERNHGSGTTVQFTVPVLSR